MDDSKRKKNKSLDPLTPVQISHETSRRIPASTEAGLNSNDSVSTPLTTPNESKSLIADQQPEQMRPSMDETDERSGTIYGRKDKEKRFDLANLLWGEKEDFYQTDVTGALEESPDPIALNKKIDSEIEAPSVEESPKTIFHEGKTKKKFEREVKRRECSFPGILTILIPTQTFQPMKLAVRVVDISPKGVRLETRQITFDMAKVLHQDRWFSRLEMLVPHREKMRIKGRIVWVDYQDGQDTSLGVQFETVCDDIEDIFSDTLNSESQLDDFILGSPELNPFPSVTPATNVTFRGRCEACEKITVSHGNRVLETKPIKGRFEISLKLSENRTNFLSFTAERGKVRSIPTPVAILHKVGASETISVSSDSLVEEFLLSENGERLEVVLHGSPARFFQALKKIEESLQYADELTITVNLTGQAKKAAQKMKQLMSEKQKPLN